MVIGGGGHFVALISASVYTGPKNNVLQNNPMMERIDRRSEALILIGRF